MTDYPATVTSVYDGDTLRADVRVWPGATLDTGVRIRGIDTPELRGKCEAEKELARQAREIARQWVKDAGRVVVLRNVKRGKYAGRVVADVVSSDESLADVLLRNGVARRYGGGKREGWCD